MRELGVFERTENREKEYQQLEVVLRDIRHYKNVILSACQCFYTLKSWLLAP